MKNIKPTIIAALESDKALINLLGGNYIYFMHPEKEPHFPCVIYYEDHNSDNPIGTELEGVTEISLTFEIYNTASTSNIAIELDRIMTTQGFYREGASDSFEQDGEHGNVYSKSMHFRRLRNYDTTDGTENGGGIAVDPWLEALALWTEQTIPAGWTVYRNQYPIGTNRPAIFWSMNGSSVQNEGSSMYKLTKNFSGLVIARYPMQHQEVSLDITRGLQSSVKIVLDSANRRYLKVDKASIVINQESLITGRINIELSRLESKTNSENAPLIQAVHNRLTIQLR